jgi:CRP-like cAMP-binding protein
MNLSAISPFQRFLDKLTSHSALGEEERQAILGLPGRPVQVQCHRDFVRLGDRVDHACLMVEGLVGRFGQNSEGLRQIVAVHLPGDMVDLHSVVAPDAGSALQALAVTTILKVPHAALRQVAHNYPAIAEAFWRECVLDAAVLAEWVVNVGRRDARTRAAHFLCELACRYGAPESDGGVRFDFPATQAHIADILALTPVHVNRTLIGFRREGLADVRGRKVHIHDWNSMVQVGDFDPSYLQIGLSANDNLIFEPISSAAE